MQFYWTLHLDIISTKGMFEKGVEENYNNIQIQQKISNYNDTNHNKLIATDDYHLTEKLMTQAADIHTYIPNEWQL